MPPDNGPNVRVPPPFFFVAAWTIAWLLSLTKPAAIDGRGGSDVQVAAGAACLAAGLTLMGWALVTFRRANTPIVPLFPARLVVTTGPFRFTRNPMYVGLTTSYCGLALILNQLWPLVLLPLALVLLTKLVIEREEAHLGAAFGDEYSRYRQQVRRWL
jgi:protein-S-isoprenylcysteine O-methyltransferase Ste14